MSTQSIQSAKSLLEQARRDCSASGELVKIILAGTFHIDSWLIENRVLPILREKNVKVLRFGTTGPDGRPVSAAIAPLPDGTAFSCHASGYWAALESSEALDEIQYIGYRYAPDNRWRAGFEASVQEGEGQPLPVLPLQVAQIWEEATGTRPQGFESGFVDQMQAIGLDVIGKAFHTQRRLGL